MGFEEIEDVNSPNEALKQWHGADMCRARNVAKYHSTLDYFQRATEFLNWYEFSSATERKIWQQHSDGLTVRKIGKNIRKSKDYVHRIIRRLQKELQCPQ